MPTTDLLDCYDVLHWLGDTVKPKSYLEIGVREGASLCAMLIREPEIKDFIRATIVEGKITLTNDIADRILNAYTFRDVKETYLFDNWTYLHSDGAHGRVTNLLNRGFKGYYQLIDGNSAETVPAFLQLHKDMFDVVFVDGDHTVRGANIDLENVYGHFKVLVFDDLYHPQHRFLNEVWRSYTRRHDLPSFTVGQNTLGVGVAFNL